MQTLLSLALLLAGVVGVWFLWQRLATRRRSRERMFEDAGLVATAAPDREETMEWLGWWLYRAGYRAPNAMELFVTATAACFVLGSLLIWLYYRSGLRVQLIKGLEEMPSGLGDIFMPCAHALPWLVLAILTALPTLRVRASRRRRVTLVEQDLPITLELLATLAEAGIGFDSGLERILDSQYTVRPLAQELRQFQLELLAGRPRTRCLRRLGRRIDVSSLTIFISALVQASQVGAGVSEVLRRQVEELRNRRRENALTAAASLPVKLLFPLVICFLPGIFVAVLGPSFYQVFQLLDNLNRNRGRP